MIWYQLAGDWQKFTGMVQAKWSKLTDDDLTTFGGGSASSPASSNVSMAMRRSRPRKKSTSSHTPISLEVSTP